MFKKGSLKGILSFMMVLALVLLAVSVIGCGPEEEAQNGEPAPDPEPEKFSWRLQVAYSPGSVEYQLMDVFVDRVRERSEGRLDIQYFSGGTLIPVDDMLTATGKGTIEAILATGLYWTGVIPVANIEAGLPFLYSGDINKAKELIYEGGLIDIFREAYAEHNVYLLGLHSWSGYPPLKSAKPVRTLADLEGLKVRIIGGFAELLDLKGASTTWIPAGELYMALKLGTVDAVGYSVDAIRGMGLKEVMNYLIMPPLADHAFGHILINTDAWNALPEDLQKIVREAEEELSLLIYRQFAGEWQVVIDMAEELGYEVITLPDADVEKLKQAAVEVWDNAAAKDDFSARAIRLVKDFYGID